MRLTGGAGGLAPARFGRREVLQAVREDAKRLLEHRDSRLQGLDTVFRGCRGLAVMTVLLVLVHCDPSLTRVGHWLSRPGGRVGLAFGAEQVARV